MNDDDLHCGFAAGQPGLQGFRGEAGLPGSKGGIGSFFDNVITENKTTVT